MWNGKRIAVHICREEDYSSEEEVTPPAYAHIPVERREEEWRRRCRRYLDSWPHYPDGDHPPPPCGPGAAAFRTPIEREFEALSLTDDDPCCNSTLGCRVRDVGYDIEPDVHELLGGEPDVYGDERLRSIILSGYRDVKDETFRDG